MLILLCSILAASLITAAVITWLLLTGRTTPQTKVRIPLWRPQTARQVRIARIAREGVLIAGLVVCIPTISFLVTIATHRHH
jgi:hypothetical protein